MYTIEIEDIENNKAKFEEIHKQPVVSSSEIATICGVGWSTPLELWAIKTGRKVLDLSASEDTLWLGTKMEPVIAELFERKTKQKLQRVNQVWRSKKYTFAVCSPDYIYEDETGVKSIVEIKNTRYYNRDAWGIDKAPDHAHCQLMWQLGVSGFNSYGFCAGLIGADTSSFYYPMFKFDEGLFEAMVQKAERFVDLVKTDTPPEAIGKDRNSIPTIFGKPNEKVTKELTDASINIIKQIEELAMQKSAIDEKSDELNEKMKDLKMKLWGHTDNHAVSLAGDYLVICRQVVRKAYTTSEKSWFEVKIKRQKGDLVE